jgi:ABC-type multidrug transport system ATPase subunit
MLEYLREKTVILVTHQLQFLRKSSKILYLHTGKCKVLGNFDQLQQSGIDFLAIVKENNKSDESVCNDTEKFNQNLNRVKVKLNKSNEEESKIKDEFKETGHVKSYVYWEYITAGAGPILFTLTLLSIISTQFLYHFSDYWLTTW